MLDAIAGIGNAFNGTVDRMAQLFGTKTYAQKVEEEKRKTLEMENEQIRLAMQAANLQTANAQQLAAINRTNQIGGIDKKYLIYGGAGLGVLLLIVLLIAALK